MFATLIVQLPVAGGHAGGGLLVRHAGKQHAVDFSAGAESSIRFAAFYADCEHELTPVREGRRLVLAYNLVRTTAGAPPRAAALDRGRELRELERAAADWTAAAVVSRRAPRLVAVPREHTYTEANLAFGGLTGRDAAVAALVLPERGRRAAFAAHLARLSYRYKHSEEADED